MAALGGTADLAGAVRRLAALLAVAAPLMAAMMIAVRLRTGQMAVFRQARVTGQGKVASIIKLRTLTAHDDADTRWTAAGHSPLGRRLRTTHLDELPQLINVMRGKMSLVGPRPERPYFYTEHWSIWLDLVILARTAATVLRGIWAAGEPEDRRGARAGGGETR